MVIVIPGRSETGGVSPGMLAGETPRDLTLGDALVVQPLPGVERVAVGEDDSVAGQRYRVAGVMKPKGTTLGFDLDDTVYIPTAKSLELFDRDSVFEIQLRHESGVSVEEIVTGVRRILAARHGDEDFTITTQQQMLDTPGSVLSVLTFAVGALGSISLLVGGVCIFTIMTIGVSERTAEIGTGAAGELLADVYCGRGVVGHCSRLASRHLAGDTSGGPGAGGGAAHRLITPAPAASTETAP